MARVPVGVGPKLPQIVVLFGATGDLAHKKLLPGLFHLVTAGFISKCRIIGVSLDSLDAEGFRALARDAAFGEHAHHPKKEAWPAFEAMLDYVPIAAGAGALKEAVDKAEKSFAEEAQRVHYLSVPPNAALSAIKMLSEAQLAGGSRVIMEKPFGTDLESAVADLMSLDDAALIAVAATAESQARTMIAITIVALVAIPWICFAVIASMSANLYKELKEMRRRVEALSDRAPSDDAKALDGSLTNLGFPKPNPMLAE